MDPVTFEAIKTFGFPVVAASAVSILFSVLVRWLLNRFNIQHNDHREDVKELSRRNEKSLTLIVETNKENIKEITKSQEKSLDRIIQSHNARDERSEKQNTFYQEKILKRIESVDDKTSSIIKNLNDKKHNN